jgi:hypothetical protein
LQPADERLRDGDLTDHVHFELLAQFVDGRKLQWPTTQDSGVVDLDRSDVLSRF